MIVIKKTNLKHYILHDVFHQKYIYIYIYIYIYMCSTITTTLKKKSDTMKCLLVFLNGDKTYFEGSIPHKATKHIK